MDKLRRSGGFTNSTAFLRLNSSPLPRAGRACSRSAACLRKLRCRVSRTSLISRILRPVKFKRTASPHQQAAHDRRRDRALIPSGLGQALDDGATRVVTGQAVIPGHCLHFGHLQLESNRSINAVADVLNYPNPFQFSRGFNLKNADVTEFLDIACKKMPFSSICSHTQWVLQLRF